MGSFDKHTQQKFIALAVLAGLLALAVFIALIAAKAAWIALIFIAVVLLVCVNVVSTSFDKAAEESLRRYSERTTAVCVENISESHAHVNDDALFNDSDFHPETYSREGSITYTPLFEYTAADGVTRRHTGRSSTRSIPVGTQVEVLVDPLNRDEVRFPHEVERQKKTRKLIFAIMYFGAAVFALNGLIMLFGGR